MLSWLSCLCREPKLFSAVEAVIRYAGAARRAGDLYASRSILSKARNAFMGLQVRQTAGKITAAGEHRCIFIYYYYHYHYFEISYIDVSRVTCICMFCLFHIFDFDTFDSHIVYQIWQTFSSDLSGRLDGSAHAHCGTHVFHPCDVILSCDTVCCRLSHMFAVSVVIFNRHTGMHTHSFVLRKVTQASPSFAAHRVLRMCTLSTRPC